MYIYHVLVSKKRLIYFCYKMYLPLRFSFFCDIFALCIRRGQKNQFCSHVKVKKNARISGCVKQCNMWLTSVEPWDVTRQDPIRMKQVWKAKRSHLFSSCRELIQMSVLAHASDLPICLSQWRTCTRDHRPQVTGAEMFGERSVLYKFICLFSN